MSDVSETTDRLLTPVELAARWAVTAKSRPAERIYRLVREGHIPPGAVVRLGSTIRFSLEGIEKFEREGGNGLDEAA